MELESGNLRTSILSQWSCITTNLRIMGSLWLEFHRYTERCRGTRPKPVAVLPYRLPSTVILTEPGNLWIRLIINVQLTEANLPRGNSEFYCQTEIRPAFERRTGNVLKASLEYYDTVKIRALGLKWSWDNHRWIYRRITTNGIGVSTFSDVRDYSSCTAGVSMLNSP